MEAPRRHDLADPEFDPVPVAPVRLRDFDPVDHQRLVVNPFLAVFLLMVWWLSLRWLLTQGPFPPMSVAMIPLLPLLGHAVQYHCLDCGRTGSYLRRNRHACNPVLIRWHERRRPRFPIPSARTQLVVWAYLIASAILLLIVVDPTRSGP